MVRSLPAIRFKAETRGNRPLLDVNSQQFELRAGSGLQAPIPIDVGVRDGAKNGVDLEKSPKMAGDVPVRYALVGPGPAPAFSPTATPPTPGRCAARILTACDWVSVSIWTSVFGVISFTSHSFGLLWATGIFGSATGKCGPSGHRKRPLIGGRTDAAPFRASIFHLPLCVLGGYTNLVLVVRPENRWFQS